MAGPPVFESAVAAWEQLGLLTKVGVFSQAATCGLLAACVRKPSKALAAAALAAAVAGLLGLSIVGIGEAEYTICGSLDPPQWCRTHPIAR